MNFKDFSLDLRLDAAIESVGFVTPTPIQEQAISMVLSGRDVLGLAQTGTGKTAAFALANPDRNSGAATTRDSETKFLSWYLHSAAPGAIQQTGASTLERRIGSSSTLTLDNGSFFSLKWVCLLCR